MPADPTPDLPPSNSVTPSPAAGVGAAGGSGEVAAPAGAAGSRGGRTDAPNWRVLVGAAVVVAIAVVVVMFLVGMRVGGPAVASPEAGAVTAASTATTTPESTSPTSAPAATSLPAAQPTGAAAPGVHAWNQLGGGECLTGYTSPWAEEFTVVDCGADHTAQLVTRGLFAEPATAAYPGEAELVSRLNLLCTAPAVLDLAAAGQLDDVQWQASYPADEAAWAAGDRAYYCFFSRSSGQPLGASLAVPFAG